MLKTADGYIVPTGAGAVNSTRECLDLCDLAAARLRAIGFVHLYTSMRSEACYYALPDYLGLIRLAAHKNKHPNQQWENRPVVAKLTYTKGTKFKSQVEFDNHMAQALGRYMMAHADMQEWKA